MNNTTGFKMKIFSGLRLSLVLVVLGFSVLANAQGVLSRPQTGTVQLLRQDDGYITISGSNYGFDYEVTVVVLAGDEIDSAMLDEGMVVRYTLDDMGMLMRLEIIGPANKIRILEEN